MDDFLIIGAGVIGLAIARALKQRNPDASIHIIEKEKQEAEHASGRNSGVLHAGFYYTADSLKARFTVEGNRQLKLYCLKKGIPINQCGKLVVAQNSEELASLQELYKRGLKNGSNVELIDEQRALEIEPNVRTYKQALYSPDTASVNPKLVCAMLRTDLERDGVRFSFETPFESHHRGLAKQVINCAGLYADQIAKTYGFGHRYTIIPFKGLYLKYTKNKTDIKTNIYPVPNLKNPFLGVHFTKTATNEIKIGPTAIPAFWRENYQGIKQWSLKEMISILSHEAKLFSTNAFNFRSLAFEEMKKYRKSHFIALAQQMVQSIDPSGFTEFTKPGIRAQLLDKKSSKLIQDFVVEGDNKSTHILNAVSPAFTCAFPFADYITDHFIMAPPRQTSPS
ncbi:MAG: L-2-hydroxyglutarate dehydrogenase [Chlamydiales bacterium]|nr:L-2-hydroxyglutarate dehydrogenase [Chlamydiales bacterium]MCH9619968.1 L-2-hydroxyglutarate dehydrogenase [Chlamydiales bacterium]MCH9622605.1 L-2-hydroxyglutarate dehydrogenase [Chlamydiales bacterium]